MIFTLAAVTTGVAALALGLTAAVIAILAWVLSAIDAESTDDGTEPGGGGGGGGRKPTPTPPAGNGGEPAWWPEFESDLAAYADRSRPGTAGSRRTR